MTMPEVESIITKAISSWRNGTPPDALGIISSHPSLAQEKSAVLELAYEEYCLRRESGETIRPSTYCDQFPAYRRSLQRLLEVHQFLDSAERKQEPKWPAPHQELLGFRVLQQLGQGRFARVYLAEEMALGGRQVVIKLSHTRSHEPQTLGRLSHPNIVPVNSIACDETNGNVVMCMPFLGSATLCDVIDLLQQFPKREWSGALVAKAAQELPPQPAANHPLHAAIPMAQLSYVDAVLWLGAQLADGLSFAHERGVVHRDLKPSNVLITPGGKPLLLDFNLSSDIRQATSRVGGTLPYMSPEQLRELAGVSDRAAAPDGRSDIYGLGSILYELLYGRPPVQPVDEQFDVRAAALATLERQQTRRLVLDKSEPLVDGAAATIVARCLSLDRVARYATAAELASALRTVIRFDHRLMRLARRQPRKAILVVGVLGLLAAGPLAYLAARPEYFEREYRAGVVALKTNDVEAAVAHLTRSIEAQPQNAKALQARAQARAAQREWDLAIIDGSRAVQFDESTETVENLAYYNCMARRFSSAAASYRKVLALGGENARIQNNLGYALRKQGDLNSALSSFTRAIELDPGFQPAFLNRAILYLNLVQGGNAAAQQSGLADVRRAIELGPPSGELYYIAASLCVTSKTSAPDVKACKTWLTQAVDYGYPVTQLRRDPILSTTLVDGEFVTHLPAQPAVSSAAQGQLLVPPGFISGEADSR